LLSEFRERGFRSACAAEAAPRAGRLDCLHGGGRFEYRPVVGRPYNNGSSLSAAPARAMLL
jgi:hypothetical protein